MPRPKSTPGTTRSRLEISKEYAHTAIQNAWAKVPEFPTDDELDEYNIALHEILATWCVTLEQYHEYLRADN